MIGKHAAAVTALLPSSGLRGDLECRLAFFKEAELTRMERFALTTKHPATKQGEFGAQLRDLPIAMLKRCFLKLRELGERGHPISYRNGALCIRHEADHSDVLAAFKMTRVSRRG